MWKKIIRKYRKHVKIVFEFYNKFIFYLQKKN